MYESRYHCWEGGVWGWVWGDGCGGMGVAGNSERLVELLGMWEMLIFINPIRYGTGSEIIKMCKGNFILPITLARRW